MGMWIRVALGIVAAAGLLPILWFATGPPAPDDALRVLTARRIITMDPARPQATAVAIASGRIVALGSLTEVRDALGSRAFELDSSFSDHVLLPGFIDPHVHPTLAATILPIEIVSAMEWTTPRGRTRPVRGRETFLERLRELDAELSDAGQPDAWLSVWGYHEPYHGELSRRDLDAVSASRPIFIWQRSVHEMFFNSRALEELGMGREAFDAHPQADWERGHLWERGTLSLGGPMMQVLASPLTYRRGLALMSEVIHRGGLTTVAEQGFPQVSAPGELAMLTLEMHERDTPYRFVLVPNAMFLYRREGSALEAERPASDLLDWGSDRIRIARHAKHYADGAIFSQLMQMSEPYLDGHHGEWMMTPDEQRAVLSAFWARDWDLHIHVNGDAGLDLVLDQIERLRSAEPRQGRRIVLEHYGYAREDQHRRVRELDLACRTTPTTPTSWPPSTPGTALGPSGLRTFRPSAASRAPAFRSPSIPTSRWRRPIR